MKVVVLSKGYECLVDDDVANTVCTAKKYCANVKQHGVYAYRTQRYGPRKEGKIRGVYLHREIMEAKPGGEPQVLLLEYLQEDLIR